MVLELEVDQLALLLLGFRALVVRVVRRRMCEMTVMGWVAMVVHGRCATKT